MLSTIREWLFRKWNLQHTDAILQAYPITFGSPHGKLVLQHLIDTVYCTIYEGTDPIGLAQHNGQRSVIQGILENIDRAQQPAKYEVLQPKENENGSVVRGIYTS